MPQAMQPSALTRQNHWRDVKFIACAVVGGAVLISGAALLKATTELPAANSSPAVRKEISQGREMAELVQESAAIFSEPPLTELQTKQSADTALAAAQEAAEQAAAAARAIQSTQN